MSNCNHCSSTLDNGDSSDHSKARATPVEPRVDEVVTDAAETKDVQDPVYSEPIDAATKLVIDLDEHIRKYLPSEEEVITTAAPANYAGDVVEEEMSVQERQDQMTALIDQVNRLAESIEVSTHSLP